MMRTSETTRIRGVVNAMMLSLVALIAGVCLSSFANVDAQRRRQAASPEKAASSEAMKAAGELTKRRVELIKAVADSKASLAQLLTYREANLRAAMKERDQLKELYAQGLVSKQKMAEGEQKIVAAQTEIDKVGKDIAAADMQVAHINETIAEEKAAALIAQTPALPRGGFVRTTSYVRFEGMGGFSLFNDAGKITNFFTARFGHAPPVSAFGQTAVHDRLGFDHRNAMDVAVHPDSAQGVALIDYLRRAGIPFIAFRSAVAGAATGAHIHIGRPSHRL